MERVAFSNMVCRCDSSIAKQNCGDFGGGGGRKCQILSIGFNQKESIPVNLFQSAELIPVNRFQSERVDSCQLGWIQFSHSEKRTTVMQDICDNVPERMHPDHPSCALFQLLAQAKLRNQLPLPPCDPVRVAEVVDFFNSITLFSVRQLELRIPKKTLWRG